jgi:DNA-binding NtrC family response regulator
MCNEPMSPSDAHSRSSTGLVGSSTATKKLREAIDRAAATNATVLIVGETGTGKGLVAKTIHNKSERRDKPMVPVICSEYPESLLESELFGYESGAHSTATQSRAGKFEQADGGTVFLDEIHTLTLAAQVKLLGVLQERTIRRAGSRTAHPIRLNIRVLSATNANLERAVREGKFRQDLFYRLAVLIVPAPALREHTEDIPALAKHFANEIAARDRLGCCRFTDGAIHLLCSQPWPGNVRQLQNVIERVVSAVAENGATITEELVNGALAEEYVFATLDQSGAAITSASPDVIADLIFDDLANGRIPLEGIKNRSQGIGSVASCLIRGFETGLKQFLGTDQGQKLLGSLSSSDLLSRVGLPVRPGGSNAFFVCQLRKQLVTTIRDLKDSR